MIPFAENMPSPITLPVGGKVGEEDDSKLPATTGVVSN